MHSKKSTEDEGKPIRDKSFPNTLGIFRGRSDENFPLWKLQVDNLIKSKDMNQAEAFNALVSHLDGYPATIYMKFIKDNNKSNLKYDKFITILAELFDRSKDKVSTRNKILKLKVSQCEDLEEYINEFRKLALLNDMTDTDINSVVMFQNGLENKIIQEEILKDKAINLEKAIETARDLWENTKTINYVSKHINRPYNENRFGKYNQNNYNRGQQTFQKKYNNKPPSYNRFVRFNNEKKQCAKCGKNNHTIEQCYFNHNRNQNYRKINNIKTEEEKEEKLYPNLEDYTVKTFNLATAGKIPTILGRIEGNEVNIGFDTGASQSIMSNGLVERLNIKKLKSNVRMKLANNSIGSPIGETEPLDVGIETIKCPIIFLIVEHNEIDALLGMDFFEKTGGIIAPGVENPYITLGRRTVFLNNAQVIEEEDHLGIIDDRLGRPENEDQIFEEMGISLNEQEEEDIEIKTNYPLNEKESEIWEKEIKPLIRERSTNSIKHIERSKAPPVKFWLTDYSIFKGPRYRQPPILLKSLQEEIRLLISANMIEYSDSPYRNPVITKEKTGKKKENGLPEIRILNDFRELNKRMKDEKYPPIRQEEAIEKIEGCSIMSIVDIIKAYYGLTLEKEVRKYTAFEVPGIGVLQWVVVPQGLKIAPAKFCEAMDNCLRKCSEFTSHYFDDLNTFSNNVIEHFNHLRKVLRALKEFGFKLSGKKCSWLVTEGKFLGLVISGSYVKIDPERTKAIKNRKAPKNRKQLESVLGSFNWLRKFINNFAGKTHSLYKLLREEKFLWNEEHEKNYNMLIKDITSEPTLAQPRFGEPFMLYSDGSIKAIGGVLTQKQEGKEHVIAYYSRLLKGAELNYGITDIECLAVINNIRHFHVYLYGNKFTLFTDHIAILNILSMKDYRSRVGRYALEIQAYDFEVKYIPGVDNYGADIASRPINQVGIFDEDREITITGNEYEKIGNVDEYDDEALLYFLKNNKHKEGLSRKTVNRINKIKHNYFMKNNKIFIIIDKNKRTWKEIPCKNERKNIVERTHLLGHLSPEAMRKNINLTYYWKGIDKDCKREKNRCPECMRHSKGGTFDHPAKSIESKGLFDSIAMDILQIHESDEDNQSNKVLVMTDYFSKLVKIYPIKDKSANEVAKKLWLWISVYGAPKRLISDQGREFVNKTVSDLSELTGIERRVTSPYNPRTDGQVERKNGEILNHLRKLVEDHKESWINFIPAVEMTINMYKESTVTKYTPYELVYGKRNNEFLDYTPSEELSNEEALYQRMIEIK